MTALSAQYRKQHMQKKLVFGLGQTGMSCVRFLVRQGYEVAVFDTRATPPLIEDLYRDFPNVEVTLEKVSRELFENVDQVVLSPGISMRSDALKYAREKEIEIVGDIELFALSVNAPIIAVTGSNGKTTTTTLISEIFRAANLKIETGGNIGTPVLDMLELPQPDFYVLELSSFQLETTKSLRPAVAVLLNISADHMDRYDDLDDYAMSKMSIVEGALQTVINLDDQWLSNHLSSVDNYVGFREGEPAENEFGLLLNEDSKKENQLWIAQGSRKICNTASMKLQGRHQMLNAVAAAAVAHLCDVDESVLCKVLESFSGLEHRTQFVRSVNQVDYINDSKGTNVGATVAAINGLNSDIILIAGGDGKGADFKELAPAVAEKVRYAILFGRDAGLIEKAIADSTTVHRAMNLEAAVSLAHELAKPDETVLLSPACASFDMFSSYQHRGDVFMELVGRLEDHV